MKIHEHLPSYLGALAQIILFLENAEIFKKYFCQRTIFSQRKLRRFPKIQKYSILINYSANMCSGCPCAMVFICTKWFFFQKQYVKSDWPTTKLFTSLGFWHVYPIICILFFCVLSRRYKGVLWRKERRNKLHLPVLRIFAKGKEVGLEENSSLEACWHVNTPCFSMFTHAWFCLFSSFGVGFHDYTTFHNHFMIAPQHIIP